MARETLLSKVPIPGDNIYRIRGEIDPEGAAKEYGLMLKEKFSDGGLDVVLLGMGDDGHTASLFPGTKAVDETKHRVVANYAENSTTGKSWRVTMTAPFINRAAQVIVLVPARARPSDWPRYSRAHAIRNDCRSSSSARIGQDDLARRCRRRGHARGIIRSRLRTPNIPPLAKSADRTKLLRAGGRERERDTGRSGNPMQEASTKKIYDVHIVVL
jgi:hypothetical protein